MQVSYSQKKEGEGARKPEDRNQKSGSITETGKQKKQEENHIWSLGFFKAVENYYCCKADIRKHNKNTSKNADRIIFQKKII